ncbi:uncharacterized protein JCM6883_002940 [Sporobolomyces salmoneus]|uniref:uncharacterized protein n=1 Tax=Sporobolomyces salmoneus TaxID=183962 RepID=UPI00317A0639
MAPPLMSFGRTSVVGWSPSTSSHSSPSSSSSSTSPLLATGTVSGALDDSFSSESLLELWEPFESTSNEVASLEPIARVSAPARFNRIAWGSHGINSQERPLGIIAGGLENGNVALWDPSIALYHQGHDPLISRFETHSGPVRGLDFSSAQSNFLASGATNGEIFIYDLSTPNTKPFSPGPRSRSLDTITSLSWNPSVVHILASGSNSGYTVVWDLKSKREITALSYAGAGPTGLGAAGFGAFGGGAGGVFGGGSNGASGVGGLGGVSSVKWHPENPTKLVTASDDDHSPVILLWDLRNWKEPERVLRGHEKGILSVAWCKDDSDLIISSGKDGRTIAWGASTGEIVAEVAPSTNWAFDTAFCPRNPSIISTASLDGTVSLHSLQSTNVTSDPSTSTSSQSTANPSNPFDSSSVFEQAISANAANYPTKSLTLTPKWLKRPASVAFGFGGKLVHIHHDRLPPTSGGGYSLPKVEIKKFVASPPVVERAQKLEQASTGQLEGGLAAFCDQRTEELEREGGEAQRGEVESWKLLKTLFHAAAGGQASQNREQLIELLGYDKEGVKERIDQVVAKFSKDGKTFFSNTPTPQQPQQHESSEQQDPEIPDSSPQDSFAPSQENGTNDGPSLFGDDQGGDDFFSQIGAGGGGGGGAGQQSRLSALPERLLAKEGGSSLDGYNSAAATIGSASSIASLNLKPSTFKMYNPSSTSKSGSEDVDRLITQALVIGDFTSAVSLALATDRFADALLFALRGGSELLAQTQSTYFARAQQNSPNSGSAAYLRILESITMNDLSDIVQNADLADWVEVFVLLCTFAAQEEEFGSLVEALGQRLEYQFQLVRGSPDPSQADEWRKNAILCYLAAGKLEKVVGVWVGQMKEEEEALKSRLGGNASASASFEAHARALQDFVEKVQVFQHAVGYVDVDLQTPTQSTTAADLGARTYKLASLYERYVEYAELLAEQGLTQLALKYINLTPPDFEGTKPEASGPALARERLVKASGVQARSYGTRQQQPVAGRYGANPGYGGAATTQQTNLASSTRSAYNPYSAPPVAAAPAPSSYNPYGAPAPSTIQPAAVAPSPYAPQTSNPYAPVQPTAADNPYAPPPPVAGTSSIAPNPYAAKPVSSIPAPSSSAPTFPSQAQGAVNDPYAPTGTPGSGLPAPPAIREASPNFASRQPAPATAPPPPRAKPDQGWNDAPILSRKSTPGAGATSASSSKIQAITSPFPNMPSAPAAGPYGGYGAQPGQAVPPPPPSRGSNRTPAPPSSIAPPPMTGSRFVPPPPPSASTSAPPPVQQQQQQQPISAPPPPQQTNYAPPPPKMNSNYAPPPPSGSSVPSPYAPPPPVNGQQAPPPQRSGFPAAPPPRSGTPGNGNAFRPPPPPGPPRSTATPPPGAPNFPRPPSAGANRSAFPPPMTANNSIPPVPPQHFQPQGQAQSRPPPPPQQVQGQSPAPTQSQFAPAPPPPQSMRPPQPSNGSVAPPPPSMNGPPPPPPAAAMQARPEPPKLQYPPGDRTHISEKNRPIFDILTLELRRLRQTTPPQQAKMINETEKRLNMLFDLINCEALSEPSTEKVLEICQAIESRNQPLALDLHLALLTTSNDVAPFQAALKLVIQRLS